MGLRGGPDPDTSLQGGSVPPCPPPNLTYDFKDIDSEKIRDFLKPDHGCEEGKYYKMVLTEQSLLDS